MIGQSLNFRFDSIGAGKLAGDFVKTGNAADVAARATDKLAGVNTKIADTSVIAAKGARLVSDALEKQRKASDVSAGATIALSKADRILAEAEHVLADGALEADFALRKQADAAQKAGDSSARAAGEVSALAGTGGIPGGGMGALIGAGALLSPVLLTVGAGLGGLGLAAAGSVRSIDAAAQKTGGLAANMKQLDPEQRSLAKSILGLGDQYSAFEKKLQPQVISDFNAGIRLGGHLMSDLEPVASATGKALGGLLGDIDAEFRSNNWQNFFHFMAQTAGPDVKLLGDDFVSLSGTLPTLLEGLQPVATSLLTIVNYTGHAIRLSELASTNFSGLGKASQQSGDGFNATTTGLKAAIPGMEYANRLARELGSGLDILYGNSGKAGRGTQDLAAKARDEAAASKAQTAAMNKLNAAITTQIARVLTLEGDQVSWKQAQQAATTAINANHRALDGNSASALAARAAIIQSTSAVIKFADDSDTSAAALRRGSSALQDQIRWLEKHAGKSKIAAQEIKALRQEEAKIKREIDQRIKVTGSGRFSVAGSGLPGGIGHRVGATGGRVPGYGGGDVHPYLLEGGEAIVPKHLTPAVAPFLKAHGVPGFSAGGLVPTYSGGVRGLGAWAEGNTQAVLRSLDQSVASAVQNSLQSAPGALGGPTSASAAAAQAYARSRLGAYGWSGSQMPYLALLWTKESGWNRLARNPSSGAYGIPQALPASKMGAAANPPLSSAAAQINWGLGYIGGRYGSPAGAWAHERAFNWYAGGTGGALPGWAWVGERGPELVRFHGGEDVLDSGTSRAVTRGYAKGTDLAKLGRELLRRHHSGVLDTEIRNTSARYHQDLLLSRAPGGRHRQHYAALARSEHHHLVSLEHTRAAERAYRAVLQRRVATLKATEQAARKAHLPGEAARLASRVKRHEAIIRNIDLWLAGKPKPKAVPKPKAAAATAPTGNMDIADWAAYLDAIHGGAPGLAAFATGSWFVPATAPAVVHRGEMIFPADMAQAVRDAVSGSGNGGGQFTGELYLDSGELLGVVDGRIEKSDRKFNRRVGSGTGRR